MDEYANGVELLTTMITSSCDDDNNDYEWQETWTMMMTMIVITGRCYNDDNFCVWHEMTLIIMSTATSMRNALIAHVDDL